MKKKKNKPTNIPKEHQVKIQTLQNRKQINQLYENVSFLLANLRDTIKLLTIKLAKMIWKAKTECWYFKYF